MYNQLANRIRGRRKGCWKWKLSIELSLESFVKENAGLSRGGSLRVYSTQVSTFLEQTRALQAILTYSYSIQFEKKKSQHTSWCLPSSQVEEDVVV